MTAAEFNCVLGRRLARTREVLAAKADEYASETDRLHNFKRAAELGSDTPAEALLGMLRKHWVSLMDLADRSFLGVPIPAAVVDEKIGDAVNYLILLEAVLLEPVS